jgi:hypothetical protein
MKGSQRPLEAIRSQWLNIPEGRLLQHDTAMAPDWHALIIQAMERSTTIVKAHTWHSSWNTASKPAKLGCEDGNVYVVKPRLRSAPMGPIADQVVGRLAARLDAPVPPVALVEVPDELIRINPALSNAGWAPGLAHGMLFDAQCAEDRGQLRAHEVPPNRDRFARLAALYTWTVASDHQLFYSTTAPELVFSFDHGHFQDQRYYDHAI